MPVDIVYVLGMRAGEYENKPRQQAETIKWQAERIKQLEAEIGGLKKFHVDKAAAKTAKKPNL